MSGSQRVLHIGGSAADAGVIQEALADSKSEPYDLEWAGTLAAGLACLAANPIKAVLLDLQLPDCAGFDALEILVRRAAAIPILVVGTDRDEGIARKAIDAGARDYLLTTRLDGYWLPRALRHAIDRNLSEEACSAQTERVEITLNSIGAALLSTDRLGRITYLNRIAEAMTGWPRAEAAGRRLDEVLHIVDAATRQLAGESTDVEPGHPAQLSDSILIRRDGSESAVEHSAAEVHDHLGLVTGEAIVVRDVSAARAMSLRLSHLATHDPLTDLPNRVLLRDRLARALVLAGRHRRHVAVCFLDIDRFKYINDSLGHGLADELLKSIGQDITMCVRSSDTVSRHGGDEFVVVLAELEHAEDAAKGADKIVAAIARTRTIGGHALHVSASIGISVYPDDGDNAETLLKHADLALYQAKEQGRDGYRFFEPNLNVRALERQSIEAGLTIALAEGQLELYYQPKVNVMTGAIVGVEALLRWRHPRRGLVEPASFIAIAEDCRLICPIGRWAMHEACRQNRAWQDAGLPRIPVAVNVSAVEFRRKDFLAQIIGILNDTRLDPHCLEIELTESVLMPQVASANSVLHSLKALGVQLAIDDFGTGWSSLSYLRDFPIDTLKVDKSFVQEAVSNSRAARIVSAVIGMGKSLNHRVIAEGVETREQFAFVRDQGCEEAQGYYFSRPLSAPQFATLLRPDAPAARAGIVPRQQTGRPAGRWIETAGVLGRQSPGGRATDRLSETEQPESSRPDMLPEAHE